MSAAPSIPPDYREPNRKPPQQPPHRPLWQRILIWTGIGVGVLVLLVFIGIEFLLHSNTGHRFILGKVQSALTSAIGTPVHIRNFNLSFSGISPTVDLYNVVVEGAPPHPTPSLLTVDHLRVAVHVTSIISREWSLQQVLVEHPVVHVLTDKQGRDNLPQTKNSGQSSSTNTNIFSLGVQHAVLTQGEVYYNNQKSVMEADLHSLEFKANYHAQPQSYTGSLAYENGHLKIANFKTIPHTLHADFTATPQQFQLRNAVLKTGASYVLLNATVQDFSNPKLAGTYKVELHGAEFRNLLNTPTIPTGVINLNGSLNYASQPNVPMLGEMQMNGTLQSNELLVKTAKFSGPVRNVHATYRLSNGNFQVSNLQAQMLGGRLQASLDVANVTGAQNAKLKADLNSVSLAGLKKMFNAPALKSVGVTGNANAQVLATWQKGFKNLQADLSLDFNSNVTPSSSSAGTGVGVKAAALTSRSGVLAEQSNGQSGSAAANNRQKQSGTNSIPVTGHIQAHYSSKNGLTIKNSTIRTPNSTVKLNGAMNSKTGLAINLNHVDLKKVADVVSAFTPAGKKPSIPPGLSGLATFNGHVKGTPASPKIEGLLVVQNLHINNSEWQLLRTNIAASPSEARLANGLLTSPKQGRATFSLTAGLQKWSFTKASNFQVAMDGNQLRLPNLLGAAAVNMPAKGVLSFSVNAHGTQEVPAGTASLKLANAVISGQPIQAANVDLTSNGTTATGKLAVHIPGGTATGTGTYNLSTKDYQAQLQAIGIKLGQLAAVKAKGLDLAGNLNVRASGQGNVDNPQLTASVEIPKLQVKDQTVSNIAMQANIANHVADVSLGAQAVNTSLQGKAQVQLTGDYPAVASLNTQPIPFAPLVAVYAPSQAGNITGQTEIHADMRGPLKNPKAMTAHLVIPKLQVQYKNTIQLQAPQAIHANYVNGVLTVDKAALKGTDTDLQFQGKIPIADQAAQLSLLLQGTVDLKLAQLVNPDLTSSGQLVFDINSYGQRSNPNVEGQVRVVNAAFATASAPLGLQNGNGVLTLTKDRLEVTRFTGDVGGGRVIARGGVMYRPKIDFDLALIARNIRLLYPQGVRSGFGGNLTLTGTPSDAFLRGQVNLQNVSFTPDFDLMGVMGSFGGGVVAPPPSQAGFTDNLQLDMRINTPNGIDLVSREMSLQGGMNLTVRGTAANPVVLGRINLTDGDLIFRGNRYLLQGATVDFVNPSQTQMVLNASVGTTIDQYNIVMRFEGPIDRMRTNYNSDPSLPPADIINLLAFGKTTEASAANPNPPGKLGAESAIASAVAGQVTSRISKIAGISQLSIDPTLGGTGSGGQTNPGATVTIQQRVTSKIFVTFSTDITSTQRQVVQLQYQATPKVAISGTRDQNGGFAVDTKINKKW